MIEIKTPTVKPSRWDYKLSQCRTLACDNCPIRFNCHTTEGELVRKVYVTAEEFEKFQSYEFSILGYCGYHLSD